MIKIKLILDTIVYVNTNENSLKEKSSLTYFNNLSNYQRISQIDDNADNADNTDNTDNRDKSDRINHCYHSFFPQKEKTLDDT